MYQNVGTHTTHWTIILLYTHIFASVVTFLFQTFLKVPAAFRSSLTLCFLFSIHTKIHAQVPKKVQLQFRYSTAHCMNVFSRFRYFPNFAFIHMYLQLSPLIHQNLSIHHLPLPFHSRSPAGTLHYQHSALHHLQTANCSL